MEYFWMILAAVGAGIGTGLAGLSAVTVMAASMRRWHIMSLPARPLT